MDMLNQTKKVNEILKSRRLQKGISLHLIHQETKISLTYLEALESGQWDVFPAEVYLTGFLRKYSAHLGLDPAEMAKCYQDEMNVVRAKVEEEKKKEIEVKKQLESRSLVKGFVLLCVIGFFAIWWSYVAIRTSREEKTKNPESGRIKKAISEPVSSREEQLLLNVQSVGNVWIRVTSDANLSYEGFISSGASRSWEAKNEFKIRVGNVNSVKISLNGYPISAAKGAQKGINELILNHQSIPDEVLSSAQQIKTTDEEKAVPHPSSEKIAE